MATIKDIANKLGVSVSTVSKGLNGAHDISDEIPKYFVADLVVYLLDSLLLFTQRNLSLFRYLVIGSIIRED